MYEYTEDDYAKNLDDALKPPRRFLSEELRKVQTIKESQNELVKALSEKVAIEKDLLHRLTKHEDDLIKAVQALGEGKSSAMLWGAAFSALIPPAVCLWYKHCNSRSKNVLKSVKKGLQNTLSISCLFDNCFPAKPKYSWF